MRTLSFDTSAGSLHVCLLEDRTVVHEQKLDPGADRQQVASSLMPEVDKAFGEVGWPKRSLDLLVVGVGPGSFTGVRVAVVTARTLAQALQLPLIGVSLLETYYVAAAEERRRLACESGLPPAGTEERGLPPAGTEERGLPPAATIISTTSNLFFYGAFAATTDDPAHPIVPAGFGSAAELRRALSEIPAWYADEQALGVFSEQPAQPLPLMKNIAAIQAQLAYDRLSLRRLLPSHTDGKNQLAETFPWVDVLPLYLRGPSITVKKQKDYATPNPPNDRS
ncbi:MAG TPA: tRNA (adenosine(37)-N6)-threonylcarbamoyltransferase complex dimerization subunit type 1 TsaB [Candidatus Obscuribacterales bacterium]